LVGGILYKNTLSPDGHVCTEHVPCAQKSRRDEDVADRKLIEKYGRPHPALSIGRPSVSPKLSQILDTFLI
jgi:hypothetical protein